MTITLLPRPSLPTQAPVLHIPRPVKIERVDPFVTNRLELRPFIGQSLLLHADAERHSIRNGRSFICLKNVSYGLASESRKPVADRQLQDLSHAWCETSDHELIPPEGCGVSCIADVITYRRKDGSQSYGFHILNSITDTALCGLTGRRCYNLYHSGEYPGSFIAAVQREFQYLVDDLQSSVRKETGSLINYGPKGARVLVSIVRKYEKKSLSLLRSGADAKALRLFISLQKGLDTLHEVYTENPVY